MAVRYEIVERVLVIHAEGDYPLTDLFATWDAAFADPLCPPEPRILLDVTESTSVAGRSAREIRAITSFYLSRTAEFARPHTAVVVGRAVQYGVMRVAATLASIVGSDVRIFWKISDAVQWLRSGDPCHAEP